MDIKWYLGVLSNEKWDWNWISKGDFWKINLTGDSKLAGRLKISVFKSPNLIGYDPIWSLKCSFKVIFQSLI